jgi:hypothetical protein
MEHPGVLHLPEICLQVPLAILGGHKDQATRDTSRIVRVPILEKTLLCLTTLLAMAKWAREAFPIS